MNTFLKTYRLALTPLSPIHIGCGEDFEPTNYVIENAVLYGFDPSRAVLTDYQRARLTDAANRASLMELQRFFRDNANTFKVHADALIPVSQGVAEQYERDVGRAVNIEANGNLVFNKLFIERCSYTGPQSQPYIPGSSFKGAIRTAWLDELNDQRPPTDVQFKHNGEAMSTTAMEKRLLKGDFETSPLRLLKIADLMPRPRFELARRVLYAVNLKKEKIIKDGNELRPKGIAARKEGNVARKECIQHGQYRAFVAEAVLAMTSAQDDPRLTPDPALRPTDLRQIARQSNAYHQSRLQRELSVLDGRGMLNPAWKNGLTVLMAGSLGKKLSVGDAFLIRLGRYGGAESKTLSGEGVAQIKIMGAKGQPPTFASTTKTVWLAAEFEREDRHLMPFGWAIVEIEPQEGDLPELKAWCEAQSKGRPNMTELRQRFQQEKAHALEQKAELAAQATAREAARRAEQLAAEQREQALANMNEQGRQIATLQQKCEDWAARIANGNYKKQGADVGKAGLFQDAYALVNLALAGAEWPEQDRQTLAAMLEECLPKVIAPWDKDQRKKLRIAALRGL